MLRSTEQNTFSISTSCNRQVDKMTWEGEGEARVNVQASLENIVQDN